MAQLSSVQIIGAQKAGTSAVAKWMFEGGYGRPQVFDGEPWYHKKEAHFFDIDWNFNRGLDFYARQFRDIDGIGRPALDATPDTLAFAQRVRDTYELAGGDQVNMLKIIVILRDPVARELSLFTTQPLGLRLPVSGAI